MITLKVRLQNAFDSMQYTITSRGYKKKTLQKQKVSMQYAVAEQG